MGIFQQCFHGYLWQSSVGSEPVSPCFSGRCHFTYWVWKGRMLKYWGGGQCCNYMCIWRGLEQLGLVITAAFVILVSVGGVAETHLYSPETVKWLPKVNIIHYLHPRNANNNNKNTTFSWLCSLCREKWFGFSDFLSRISVELLIGTNVESLSH